MKERGFTKYSSFMLNSSVASFLSGLVLQGSKKHLQAERMARALCNGNFPTWEGLLLHVADREVIGIFPEGLIDLLGDVEQRPEGRGNHKHDDSRLRARSRG